MTRLDGTQILRPATDHRHHRVRYRCAYHPVRHCFDDLVKAGKAKIANPFAALPADQLIVPVAMPLIAGPGTIITAMTMAARTTGAGQPWMAPPSCDLPPKSL